MKITVKYTGQIKALTNIGTEQFFFDSDCTVSKLIQEVAVRHGDTAKRMLLDADGCVHKALLRVINDAQSPPGVDVQLQSGDTVTLIPPISGG
jgi:molybdopterin converting factor small subunit